MADSKPKSEKKVDDAENPKPGQAAPLHGAETPGGSGLGKILPLVMMLMVATLGMKMMGMMDGPGKGIGNIFEKLLGGLGMGDKHDPAAPAAAAPAAAAPVAAHAPPVPAAPKR